MRLRTLVAGVLVVSALSACGGAQETELAAGLTKDEVCEGYLAVLGGMGMTSSAAAEVGGDGAIRITSPAEAVQHLESARQAAEFAREVGPADDPEVAAAVSAVGAEAERVLETLAASASDEAASAATVELHAATTRLYAICIAEAYARFLTEGVELTGACAEPDAPVLDGPNVVRYPSRDFADSTCQLVQGMHVGDGCSFSLEQTAGPGEQGAAQEQVALDPDTCQALFETGQLIDPNP